MADDLAAIKARHVGEHECVWADPDTDYEVCDANLVIRILTAREAALREGLRLIEDKAAVFSDRPVDRLVDIARTARAVLSRTDAD